MAARKTYKGSMSDFVREHPDLTTTALVEEGKKYGMKLKETLIRVVRWKEKQASGASPKRGRRKGGFTRPTAPAQPKPALFTGKRRGRPPKNREATQNRENLTVYRDFDGNEVVAKDLPFDKVGSRLPPPELESTAREADTFCRIVTKIGTTKARALLDELEK